jgi:translation initiation factor IF-2
MGEDQEKKQRPKATLIKHRKAAPPQETDGDQEKSEKQEKKKVVVVKKKVVVVKKQPPKAAAKQEQPEEEKPQAAPEAKQPPEAEAKQPPRETTQAREERPAPQPQARTEQQTRRPPREQAPPRRPAPQPQDRQQQQQRRPDERGGRPGRRTVLRRPPQSGGAPSGERQAPPSRGPSGGRPSGPPRGRGPAPGGRDRQDQKKPAGKKFYKTKKREPYPKKREEQRQEKQVPLNKKKPPRRANPVPKEIDIMEVVTVADLAKKMNLKASELIGKLMGLGMMVTINQQIDADTAAILAEEYGAKVKIVSLYDETLIESDEDKDEELSDRPPVVTVMGHVDHGKTKLLDAIRTTDVVATEHGGITQHIGAYTVKSPQGQITFLDTPGHEAFTLMRARGAQVTDIVVLVVAADDGVMPQTVEAINHAKEAKVPIIVAINKVDLPDANPDRVKQQLSEYDLIPEDWGGNTLYCEVSALKHEGVDELMESILLQAEVLELRANRDTRAEGKIVESRVDHGRGIVSTVLIERGTLHVGDSYIAGIFPGRVRAMFNDRGEKVEKASPSMPVEILGFTGIPNAGDPFQVTESDKTARQVGAKRQELKKVEEAKNVRKITLDNLYDSIQEGEIQDLKVIIKGDVHGSVEALQTALEKLSTKEIRLQCIHSAAGAINKDDVMLAAASNAIIIGFHVRPTPDAQALADQEKVEIKKYNIIYDVVEDIRNAMEGLLAPEIREETLGTAEVRETFKVPRVGVIAGSYVVSGKIRRNAGVHVIRDGVEVYSGRVNSLKRFKDDVREVETGYECGIGVENFNDIKVGDQLEVYETREHARQLGEATEDVGRSAKKS